MTHINESSPHNKVSSISNTAHDKTYFSVVPAVNECNCVIRKDDYSHIIDKN